MVVGSYLRTAAAQLRNAAVELQMQASTARGEFENLKRRLDNDINQKETEMRVRRGALGAMSHDPDKRRVESEINIMQQRVNQDYRQLQVQEARVNGMVQAKLAMAERLQAQASQLESLAGSVDSV